MRILVLTQFCQPEPIFKAVPFAQELVRLGHQVEILTGFPNYPQGKLYRGYKLRLHQKEVIGGITVHRVPLYASHDLSSVRRVLNYISFALAAAVLGPLVTNRADVIYVYHPPGTIGLPAIAFKVFCGTPFVYDIQDMWPDTLRATGMVNSPALLTAVGWLAKLVYRQASHITVLSDGFKRLLLSRGVPADKVDVIYNWADPSQEVPPRHDPALAQELGMAGHFNILFAGNMGAAQALGSVIEAAASLISRLPAAQFVFIGDGVEERGLRELAERLHLANVQFLPRRPQAEIGKVLALADVLLVHLRKDALFEITIPSKTQAYLAAGKPILMAVRGDAADLITRAGAGLVCEPENPASIAAAVTELYNMDPAMRQAMGERGRIFYENKLSLEAGARRFVEVFQRVVS